MADMTDAYRDAHRKHLDAIAGALTAAAHLRRPRLQATDEGWVEDTTGASDPVDLAEMVTLALATAAANVGGVESLLEGRPGSWEAEGVRQLLHSTVGAAQADLWWHRTRPLDITIYVNEIVSEHTDAWSQYEDASSELDRRYEAAIAEDPEVDPGPFCWFYDRDAAGEWQPVDPAGPAWSIEAWRQGVLDDGLDAAALANQEDLLLGSARGAYIPKSAEAQAELRRLEAEHEARVGGGLKLLDDLGLQQIQEWTAYGEALAVKVAQLAAATPGLNVPVDVVVDVETSRTDAERRSAPRDALAEHLVEAAVWDTPAPADLLGTPLQRLEQRLNTAGAARGRGARTSEGEQ